MENIEVARTDVLTYLQNQENSSLHCIIADTETDDLIVEQSYRCLKSGGFFLLMSLPRRMYGEGAMLIKYGFKIVDSIQWIQTDKPDNSFTVAHLIERMNYLNDYEKTQIKEELKDLRIPKLRRSYIPIIIAQKPPEKNQTLNHFKHGVGLTQTVRTASGRTAGNIFSTEFDISPYYFLIPRIKDFEKELFARAWCHILQQFTTNETVIMDLTKGHHGVLPCLHLNRKYKTNMPVKDLSPFLRKCGEFLTRKKNERDRWGISFN